MISGRESLRPGRGDVGPNHVETAREHLRPFAVKREVLLESLALVLGDGLILPRRARDPY